MRSTLSNPSIVRLGLLAIGLGVAAPGCRDDMRSPTEPDHAPAPAVQAAAQALSFRQVSVSGTHACGVTTDDRAFCWGLNSFGQLGNGITSEGATPVPVAAAPAIRFLDIRAGNGFTCGLSTAKQIHCWGSNTVGQLGDGSASQQSLQPVQVAGGRRYRFVRAGQGHACGITTADVTFCWGANDHGELGDNSTINRRSPKKVAGGLTFVRVTTGAAHTCGVIASKKAYCWGFNNHGQIGIGNSVTQLKPIAVSGGLSFNTISAGGTHTCGTTTQNKAYCWGINNTGQLGDGTTARHGKPLPVSGGLSFSGVSAAGAHTCGVTTSNAAYCWGFNSAGQLGDGTNDRRLTPVAVLGGLQFDAVLASSNFFTCGVTIGGKGYCWGHNLLGYLGDGTTQDRSTPVPVAPPA